MASAHGFICDVCKKHVIPGGSWETQQTRVSFHCPPDGYNGGHYEFTDACYKCRGKLDAAIRKTIDELRRE